MSVKDKRIEVKQEELQLLQQKVKELTDELPRLISEKEINSSEQDCCFDSNKIMRQHINRLKEYNELRDTGLRLVQIISDERKCKIEDVIKEIGYNMED